MCGPMYTRSCVSVVLYTHGPLYVTQYTNPDSTGTFVVVRRIHEWSLVRMYVHVYVSPCVTEDVVDPNTVLYLNVKSLGFGGS